MVALAIACKLNCAVQCQLAKLCRTHCAVSLVKDQ